MRILKRAGSVLLRLVLALAVLAGGVYLWALMSTDTSLAARGIIWGGSCGGAYWTGLLGDIAQWVEGRLDQ